MTIFNNLKKKNSVNFNIFKNKKKSLFPIFLKTEKFFLLLCFCVFLLNAFISYNRNIPIDWNSYLLGYTIPLFIISVGQFYRVFRPDESIAKPFTLFPLFLLYASLMCAFNHLLLPGFFPRIDPLLQNIDEALGFYWLDIARTFSEWPLLCQFLKYIYQSSMFQIIGAVLLLGYFRKDKSLTDMFFTCIISATITIIVWVTFPSSGPSSFVLQHVLPEQFPMFFVNHEYGQRMNELFIHGMDIVSPSQTLGLVSFPSFHTVMALMCVVYSRPLKWVFPVFLVLNIFMIPAVIIHGSHYLVDLIGGVVVFTFAAWLTSKLVKKIDPTLQDHANHKTAPLQ